MYPSLSSASSRVSQECPTSRLWRLGRNGLSLPHLVRKPEEPADRLPDEGRLAHPLVEGRPADGFGLILVEPDRLLHLSGLQGRFTAARSDELPGIRHAGEHREDQIPQLRTPEFWYDGLKKCCIWM